LRPCIALVDIATHGLLALGIAMIDWIVLVAVDVLSPRPSRDTPKVVSL
jgi:hypothetical protein